MKNNFLNKFTKILEKKIMPIAVKVGKQRHLVAIRDGMIFAMPLTIIGGLFLILASPPINPANMQPTNILKAFLLNWYNFAAKYSNEILTPFNMTMGIMSIVVAMGIAYTLAKSYKLQPFTAAVTSGVTFLLTTSAMEYGALLKDIEAGGAPLEVARGVIPTDFLGGPGLFTAIIIGILSVEITRFLMKKGMTVKMPDGVPPAIAESFNSVIPIAVNVIVFYGLNLILKAVWGIIIPELIGVFMAPLLTASNSAWFVAIIILIGQVGWFFGIHDTATVWPLLAPLVQANLLANAASKAAGLPLEAVMTQSFWVAFLAIGGSGATLALVFWLIRSKSAHLKTVGKLSLLPGLFNINEPLIFGMPIFLNPSLFIPFVLIPPLNGIIAYFSMELGFIAKPFVDPPWTTPSFLIGPLSTMDWKAGVLVILLFIIDLMIYYPFFKVYEKSVIKEERLNK